MPPMHGLCYIFFDLVSKLELTVVIHPHSAGGRVIPFWGTPLRVCEARR